MKQPHYATPPRPHRGRVVAITAIALLSLVSALGCGGIELESHWKNGEIAVDGVNEEWGDYAVYFEDEGFIVGVLNDGEHLYVGLMASNHNVSRQVMAAGLIVWLDPENDKNKQFGIRFPLGMRGMGMQDQPSPETMRGDDTNMQERFEQVVAEMDEFEILRPKNAERTRVSFDDDVGVNVRLGHTRGVLVYELRVPIGSGLFAVDAKPGGTIALGLESPEIDFGDMRERMRGVKGGGMRGGGRPPGGGMKGSMQGGGRPSGSDFEKPEPFDVWAKVHLASTDMSTH